MRHSFSLFRTNVAQSGRIFANGALSNTQDVVDEDDDDVFSSPMTIAASESEGESDEDVAAKNEDDADSKQEQQEREADSARIASGSKLNSLFSSVAGYTLKTWFGTDGILGSLASGNAEYTGDEDVNDDALAARRLMLLALHENADTYLEPPMDAETSTKWKTATQSDELETVKAEVLEHYPAVVEKFSELVPSAIDAETFWMHYIYNASLLAVQE
ncbi:hypothetical protein FI667_g7615, partial [Globisporangium splendens]